MSADIRTHNYGYFPLLWEVWEVGKWRYFPLLWEVWEVREVRPEHASHPHACECLTRLRVRRNRSVRAGERSAEELVVVEIPPHMLRHTGHEHPQNKAHVGPAHAASARSNIIASVRAGGRALVARKCSVHLTGAAQQPAERRTKG